MIKNEYLILIHKKFIIRASVRLRKDQSNEFKSDNIIIKFLPLQWRNYTYIFQDK